MRLFSRDINKLQLGVKLLASSSICCWAPVLYSLLSTLVYSRLLSHSFSSSSAHISKRLQRACGWAKRLTENMAEGHCQRFSKTLNFPRVLVPDIANPAQFCGVPEWKGPSEAGLSTPGERYLHKTENTTQTSTSLFFKGQIHCFDLLQFNMEEMFSLMLLLSSFCLSLPLQSTTSLLKIREKKRRQV